MILYQNDASYKQYSLRYNIKIYYRNIQKVNFTRISCGLTKIKLGASLSVLFIRLALPSAVCLLFAVWIWTFTLLVLFLYNIFHVFSSAEPKAPGKLIV